MNYNEVLLRRKNTFDLNYYPKEKNYNVLMDIYNYDKDESLNYINKFNITINTSKDISFIKQSLYDKLMNDYYDKVKLISKLKSQLSSLGYKLDKEFDDLLFYTKESIINITNDLTNILNELTGNNNEYHTLKSLPSKSTINNNIKTIHKGSYDEYIDIINNLVKSKIALSNVDINDIKNGIDIVKITDIPLKENLILLTKLYLDNNYHIDELINLYKTTTDVYRLIIGLSNGDISLSTKSKIRCFKRREQRFILSLLDNILKNNKNALEDMYKRKNDWIVALFKLNPGKHKQYKYALNATNILRNNDKIETFTGKVNNLLNNKEYIKAIDLLKNKPGEFARRLNEILNKDDITEKELYYIMDTYKNIVNKLSSNVLISIIDFFENYNKNTMRVFIIKNKESKSYHKFNECKNIKDKFIKYIIQVSKNALVNLFMQREYMGNVYLSETLKNFKIPNGIRESNGNGKIVTRGSRVNFDYHSMRFFIHWTNTEKDERIDIDLSCLLLDENLTYISSCDYTTLKNKYCVHSGDILNGGPIDGEGVAEFLDVNIDLLKQDNVKYVIPIVFSFSRIPFNKLNCTFGYLNSTSEFDPSKVEHKINLTTTGQNNMPFIIDVENNEIIYSDCNINYNQERLQSINGQLTNTQATIYNILHMQKMNMYDLIKLNIQARGIEVELNPDTINDIDYMFVEDKESVLSLINNANKQIKVITPYDIDVFVGDLM